MKCLRKDQLERSRQSPAAAARKLSPSSLGRTESSAHLGRQHVRRRKTGTAALAALTAATLLELMRRRRILTDRPDMNIEDDRYLQYFAALKQLYTLHTSFNFGKSPDIPSGFSESLTKHLLQLDSGIDRTHDALDSNGQRVEIKATGSKEGKTTISNSNEFDILIWIYIDFESNALKLHRIPRKLFQLSGQRGRSSITLSKIAEGNNIAAEIYMFKSSRSSIQIDSPSLTPSKHFNRPT